MHETEADKAALKHLEPVEPVFVVSSVDKMDEAEQVQWFQTATEQLRAEGANFFRYSVHETVPNLRMVEGWKSAPANQADQKWPITA